MRARATPLREGYVAWNNTAAGTAVARPLSAVRLGQVATGWAHKNILRMTAVLRDQVAREEIHILLALRTTYLLDPKEVLDVRVCRTALQATGLIEIADLPSETGDER